MTDRSDERELRALATMCRQQARGATTNGAAHALAAMAESYDKQADRLHATEAKAPKSEGS
jgi:hypothetical protein